MGMADPFPKRREMTFTFYLERCEDPSLSCLFCHHRPCLWETGYRLDGQTVGVGVCQWCAVNMAPLPPLPPET